MTGTLTEGVGFAHPSRRDSVPPRHAASLELIAGMALVVSTVIAATVVSIGIARAATLAAAPTASDSLAAALLLGLVLASWGGLTVLMTRKAPRRD